MPLFLDPKRDHGFETWYKSSQIYRRFWVPHGIDQTAILRSLYRHRDYGKGILLDVGCGTRKFADLYKDRVVTYWGIDLLSEELHHLKTVDAYADARQLPFSASSIDTVLCTQMLGFVEDPVAILSEIQRVLVPGGCVILSYSQSGAQSGASDYFRFTPAYYRLAFARAGLNIEILEPRTGTLGTIGEMFSSMIYYRSTYISVRLRKRICHYLQKVFTVADRIFFDPENTLGHTVIARKPALGGQTVFAGRSNTRE